MNVRLDPEREKALGGILQGDAEMQVPLFDDAVMRRVDFLGAGNVRMATIDLRVAATALVHACTVPTGDVSHFRRVPGLDVEELIPPCRPAGPVGNDRDPDDHGHEPGGRPLRNR